LAEEGASEEALLGGEKDLDTGAAERGAATLLRDGGVVASIPCSNRTFVFGVLSRLVR
jgi:hypothetical protein